MWRNFFLALLIFLPINTYAATTLTSDLRLGINSPEVKILQQILNIDPVTAVSTVGDGSKGYETEYFGQKTLAAVKKFQLKYKDRVLVPAGLTEPTGFVGPLTRSVLNELASGLQSQPAKAPIYTAPSKVESINDSYMSKDALAVRAANFYNKSPAELPQYFNLNSLLKNSVLLASSTKISKADADARMMAFASTTFAERHKVIKETLKKKFGIDLVLREPPAASDVQITALSTYQAEPGEEIKIYGRNFSASGNTVYWNSKAAPNITSSASVIIAKIPEDISGRVLVYVENSEHKKSAPLALMVNYKNRLAPKITSINPLPADLMKPMTLKGRGFAKSNQLYTTFGMMDGVVSTDGITITLNLSDMPGFKVYKTVKRPNVLTDISIWIANENGASDPYGPFKINL